MTKSIVLTKGKSALVDDDAFEKAIKLKWHAIWNGNKWYAAHALHKGHAHAGYLYLHRFLMNAPSGIDVDHVDNDGLNCTWHNMRLATRTQNNHNKSKQSNNTSGYKNVFRTKNRKNPWCARIIINRKARHLGVFKTAKEAAHAYDDAAKELLGSFAKTNFQNE